MTAGQAGYLLGSRYADEQLRRRGLTSIAEPTLRSHAHEAWEVAQRLVDEGPRDGAAFCTAFVVAFRGAARVLPTRLPR